jgi:hypothetical protein
MEYVPRRIRGAKKGATFVHERPELEYLVDERGWYPYQRIPEKFIEPLDEVFSRFGLDVREVWVVVKPIPVEGSPPDNPDYAAGMHRRGQGIALGHHIPSLSPDEIVARVLGHEIGHVVQEMTLGEDRTNARSWEDERNFPVMPVRVDGEVQWRDTRYEMPLRLRSIPVERINPVSQEYALEAFATRFGDEVQSRFNAKQKAP